MPSENHIDIYKITQPIIFVVDASGSNQGFPMALINSMLKDCISYLRRLDKKSDYAIKIGILKYNIGCEWITKDTLMRPDEVELQWEDIVPIGYGELGCALHELNTKLSRYELLKDYAHLCHPVILFISDGAVSSIDEQYQYYIEKLWTNKLFTHSIRLALCIGKICDQDVLFRLVGNGGHVIETGECNPECYDSNVPLLSIVLEKISGRGFKGSEQLIPELKSISVYDVYRNGSQLMGHKAELIIESTNNECDSWDEDDWL